MEWTLTLDADLPSIHAMLLPTLPSTNIQCLTHWHSIPHSMASDQGTHFTTNTNQHWAPAHGIHWFYHVPQNPEADGLKEWWSVCLKSQ